MAEFVLSAFADEAGNSLDEQIAALNGNGIRYIEPRNIDGKGILDHTEESLASIKERLDAAGIKVGSLGSPIGKYDITKDQTDHWNQFLHTLDLAEIFGAKCIRMFSYFYPEGEDVHKYRDEIFANLEKLVAEAEKRGITLCHENEARIYGEAVEDCKDLINHFGGRLKSVLDMGNFAFCHQDPYKGYEAVKETIEYIHIKDAFDDGKIVVAGNGEGRIEDILRDFNGYTDKEVVLTLEPHLTVFDGLKNLSNMDDIKVQEAYETPEIAFDAAVEALRAILARI